MAQEDFPIAKEGCPYGTRVQRIWHNRAVHMAQEDIPIAKEGCPYGTRGQRKWHNRTVHMAQEDIPIAKEGCPYGTRGQCIWHRTVAIAQESSLHGTGRHPHGKLGLPPWHRKSVFMTQEGCRYGTGEHPHGRVEIPAMSANHQRTHTDMPWQGFDFALQITRPPEGDRRWRPLSEGRHTNC
jgi:glutaredoxin